jgi:cytochrome c oxidase assembly protein subunit 15
LGPISPAGRFAIALVFLQIALGGWVSSNYAALACNQFPTCLNDTWWPDTDFAHGFTLLRELGATGAGDALPFAALTAIHLAHRIGALLVLLVVGRYGFGLLLAGQPQGGLIIAALALQLGLGIGNVLFALPLTLAVMHNLGAAALLAALIAVRVQRPASTP